MKLSTLKKGLNSISDLTFRKENGETIPAHFHVTEAGALSKHFIDCGGTFRREEVLSFQIWVANDTEHRLSPARFSKILDQAAPLFPSGDPEIEVEYQNETIGRYALEFTDDTFVLQPKHTNCLASDQCGVTPVLAEAETVSNSCKPGSGCC